MPMMVVDDDGFAKELERLSNKSGDKRAPLAEPELQIVTSLDLISKVVDIQRGRGAQRLEVPSSLRQIISEESINGASAKDLSKAFDISPSSISAYKNDATSTASYDKPNEDLKKSNDVVRTQIMDTARGKLLLALDHVTSDKLSEARLGEIASVAASMSSIVKNMEPQIQINQNQVNNQVIVYRPKMRDEDDFDVIDLVNEA